MLNKILIIAAIILLGISIAFEVNYFNYASPIGHYDYEEISLKDFRGLNKIGNNLHGSDEFAFIVTEIKATSNKYPYNIKALFHPSRSYVYKTNTIGEEKLLAHELYHFHITEYIARRLRAEILNINPEDIDIEKLLQDYQMEENAMQKLYDSQTYHSYYIGEQLAWQAKVDSLLLSMEKYQ